MIIKTSLTQLGVKVDINTGWLWVGI